MNLMERLRDGWKQLKNERLYRRVPLQRPVTLRIVGGEMRTEEIGNWSPGGLFITTENVLSVGTIMEVEFQLGEKSGSSLKLWAQVVRHQSDGATGKMEGMGVMFTDFSQSGMAILRDLLTQAYSA